MFVAGVRVVESGSYYSRGQQTSKTENLHVPFLHSDALRRSIVFRSAFNFQFSFYTVPEHYFLVLVQTSFAKSF